MVFQSVLNLVINGIPSIRIDEAIAGFGDTIVLNLVINGIPSIQKIRFKRCKTF